MGFIDTPLPSVAAYVEFMSTQDVPVLRRTVKELAAQRDRQEGLGAKAVAAVVLADPLMTMKLLTTLQANRPAKQNHDITTIDRAIMMMGLAPFFDRFANMPTVEDTLVAHPKALVGVLKVIGRARRAAHYARDWAILRHDLDVDEITVAALLQEAVEILCWIAAPNLTQRVYDMQRGDRWLRSPDAQRAVFGTTAQEILFALVRTWQLPELLTNLMDETLADHPRVRNVVLAANFARHLSNGWDNDALPDDIAEIERLVRLNRETLLSRLGVPQEELFRFVPPAT
ncbi:MAG TPA: HDOD domain-containing protein [Aromatoleum sp.]|uniref:HDOD domain-containing protein n=1 Tax=Aromatoleum sp. TaxID=2307007 RepID=UPI002B45D943|nr:HDOD domain-containing protein [Aromatoleum sp.]HJV26868.1 HDOD domain-containing protein [Aromatoleum sp.]